MGKMTADELRRAGEAYRSENNGAQKSPVTVSANTEGSSKKMTASELRQAGEAYRKANGLSDPIYRESPATVVDKYSAPSTQPTQAAPAGASSRKQSEVMQEQVDALKKQRDDAAIKASAYMRAGNMQQQLKEQLDILDRVYVDSVNAETKLKTQKNIEATEDYDPSKNEFKSGTAALATVQDFGQSFLQGAGVLSHNLGRGEADARAAAYEAKRLIDGGMNGADAFKSAGLVKEGAPITDYKTIAELKNEKDRNSVGSIEGLGIDAVNTLSGMAIPAVASAADPTHLSGLFLMGVSSLGRKYVDAYEKYGDADLAFVLSMGAGAATVATEQFGGIYGKFGKSAAGKSIAKKLMTEAPGLYKIANSVGGKWLIDAISEGIEEGAEDAINYAVEKSITGESDEMDNFGYDILLGALAGGVLGGGNAAVRSTAYNRTGKALNASPEAVAQQVQEGLEKGAGTAPAIYAAEVQKNPSNQMVGRLFEANRTFDRESGLSKIQGDITQISTKEIKAMVSDAQALAQAAQKLNVEATPQAVATAITEAQRTESIKTAEDSVGHAFAPNVDNPVNEGAKAYNSALAGVAANQGIAGRINNDPAAKETFSRLTGVQFTGNTAQDIAAIEVATRNIAKSGKQAVSQAEYAQRVAAAGEQAAAQFDANMQAQAEQLRKESNARWLSLQQNTVIDIDGKRHLKEITNTDVRGNTGISYKKADITKSKKKAVDAVNNAAKYLGKTIVWYEGALQVNGQYRLANGFRAPDGTIYVNINSKNPLMVTFGHEMFHDLVADSKYSGMIDTLVENPDYADMVKGMMNAKTELYERNGIELDPNAAAEEVAADISGDLLDSRDMLEYIGARNTEAATGIKGFLNRILKKLKGKPSAQEAYNRLSEAQRALIDGMEAMSDAEEAGKISYSVMDAAVKGNNRPFAEQFADYKSGKMRPTDLFYLNNTSEYLQAAGLANEPIVMAQSVVTKAQRKATVDTHGHELSDDVILKLPEMIEKPVLLLKSDTVPDSAVVVTSVADGRGNPVVVALHLSRNNGFDVVTRIASLYGKKNSRNFIADQLIRGNLIGYSKKEANRLLHRDGLQLPRRNTAVDFDTISVAQDTDAVNNYSMQNSAEDASGKHSLMNIPEMDSTGRELSAEQREYFKDSKVRDEGGNLLVVYHGTDADFTVFDASKGRANMDIQGMFFSPWELDAQGYGKNVSAYYLNITNPASEALGYKALNMFKGENNAGVKAKEYLQSLGYDGVNNGDEEYIAFSPEQIKLVDNTSPTESKDIRYSLMDDVYLDAVKRGDTVTEQRLVSEAAKEAGAILDANGRRPLHLYHGTNTFGYTKFRDGVIYATPNQSVAAGYGRTGYAKPRIVSDVYVPDDGTMDTLIKNAKNVLDWKLQETTVNDRQEARDAVKKNADSIAALVDKVWTSDAVDAMELTEEQANALSNVLALPSYISEAIDDIGTYTTVDEVAYWISRFNDGLPIIRSYINENRDSLKSSPAWDMARLILGYDLSDFAIDAEYRLVKSYEEDLLSNTNGNFVSADVVREEVEKAKDIGSYTLYGFAGDRPLVIDGGGAFWANVPVDVWGGTYTTDDIVKRAKDEGYTSVLIKNINDVAMNNYSANIKADIYAFFSPEQVKSADPVVYDDKGNVIPLSERFSPDNPDIRYSLMEDAQYMADIDKAVAEATAKSEEALKAAQTEVKELRQQLLDYRQRATAEAKMNERWRDAETKLVADLAAAKEREKAAKARAEFMAKYDALAKQYRADLRANNQQAQEKYTEKLTEAKDEFNRRRTQDRIDRVVREDQAKSKARLRAAEQKSTTTDDVARVLTEMPKKDKEAFKAKAAKDWRTFKRQWFNTKDELERFGNEVGDNRIMYAANNVGQAAAAAQYSIGGAGQYDLNGKKIGDKNLMQVFEPAKKAGLTDEFYTYLLHEHNVDRMSVREKAQRQLAELREKLNREVNGFAEMTDENISTAAGKDTALTKSYTEAQISAAKQYKQFQAWAEKQFDKPVFGSSVTAADSRAAADKLLKEHPEFEKWAKDVYAYLDGLMELRKQGGLVSDDMAQYMKELYPHYVPTYRDMPSTSGGYSNPNSVAVNSTIKSAKGGNQDIMPLIDSIARQTLQTFSAAKKNILDNMLYEDAMDTTRDISEYIQSVTEDGELVDLDADSAETLKNTLRIWVDGKPVTLHMSEAMADGFRPIEQSNSFGMKALRSINSTFKKLVTQWNPVFIVRNFVRDAQSALYFTHYSNATFIKNYGKAVKEIATNGKYWQLYQAMGGKGTTYYDPKTGLSDRHHFKNGAVDKVAGGLNRVIDILSFANEAVEQYPRLAEFISTMEATGDVQQALYNAADITTNFGRGGFAARKLNASLVPFFNPGMQGLSKNIRNVIDRRGAKEIGQLISRLLLNGVMPGIIMSLVYDGLKEDDDYKELSNYIKDSNILIKIGDDKFIKVPMGREPSVITAFTNRMWRWLKGEPASSAFASYPSFAIEQIAPNNPLTNNIFAGITAMSTNKNWYGGDIVSSYMEEKPDYLQYDESTDAFSIWLGEITRHGKNGIEGLSPKKVNYLIDQYSGFIGDWVLPALSKKADVPAVVKAFVVDSVRQNRLGSDFYDALDEAKQVKETEFATAADDATYSYLYKQSKAASEITKQLKEIYNSGEKTRKEKMSEARDLLELRNEIYRNALLTVGTYEETAKSIDSADSDVVKREANRKAFGAEYALKTYNNDVGEKAAEYVAQGVTYDQYYAAYFATRGITGDKDENGKAITNSASRKKKEAIDKAVPNATTKQKHLLYEALGVSEKVW